MISVFSFQFSVISDLKQPLSHGVILRSYARFDNSPFVYGIENQRSAKVLYDMKIN